MQSWRPVPINNGKYFWAFAFVFEFVFSICVYICIHIPMFHQLIRGRSHNLVLIKSGKSEPLNVLF